MKRQSRQAVKGFRTQDGAGVSLVRVLGNQTIDEFDPFLMLDSFDSTDYHDYIKGFPMHPHRGIETVTYLSKGGMLHRDTMGNKGQIKDGGVQWMTAGSGLLHEEMPLESDLMQGIQLWLNLPKKDKMTQPSYYDIPKESIPVVEIEGGELRVIAGKYNDIEGHQGLYLPLTFYAINLENGSKFTIPTKENDSAFVFLLKGNAKIAGKEFEEKTAVSTSKGDELDIEVNEDNTEILFLSAPRLDEPVAWGGPVVMNTDQELNKAFDELRNGTFIKEKSQKIRD
ncbi:pirin family protein [Peptostreptococcus equinus]|uniref:Pirin family protein n=1 Tax=Peptostreptococcus equinus TaxID=3003601 RepID=A0ABY7JM55_9FIRM|nr:pirin family protein [Peptostreptococcus sp. CBA3647]WAW14439.1 pirin family protein [Peptostreptococcus sp. CBA3647]